MRVQVTSDICNGYDDFNLQTNIAIGLLETDPVFESFLPIITIMTGGGDKN